MSGEESSFDQELEGPVGQGPPGGVPLAEVLDDPDALDARRKVEGHRREPTRVTKILKKKLKNVFNFCSR